MTVSDSSRPYLSIGEVLGLLLEEFPDVTISKIRFLESQGLIDPERTPSGYRKFHDPDVDRLKVILREQRENFLPLRVIRDRLESGQIDDSSGPLAVPRGLRNVVPHDLSDETGELPVPHPDTVTTSNHPAARLAAVAAQPVPAAAPANSANRGSAAMSAEPRPSAVKTATATLVASLQEPPVLVDVSAAPGASAVGVEQYSAPELCKLSGLTTAQLHELESFGLLAGRGRGASALYSGHELAVAKAARGFLQHGIEGRHLRAWRQAADRETALFEQMVTPLLRQRNPQARQQAADLLVELTGLGSQLRAAIVSTSLAAHLDS